MHPTFIYFMDSNRGESLGKALRHRRIEQKLTQQQVASRADISAGYLGAIESGRGIPPTPKTLGKILNALGVPGDQSEIIQLQARLERGVVLEDMDLPAEALDLVLDIRRNANVIDPQFLRGLRAKLREVLS